MLLFSAHWFLAIICFPYLDAAEYEGDRTNESENSSVELNQSADSESTGQSMEVVTDPSEKDELSQGGTGPSVIPETPPSSTTAPASGASFIGPRLPDDLDPQEAQDYDDEMEQNKMMEKSGDDTSSETASVTGGKKTRVKKRLPCFVYCFFWSK